jgi:hypothetical protein
VPTFCRHNRFIQNCPICREPEPPKARRRTAAPARPARAGSGGGARTARPATGGVLVRRAGRAADDGYRNALLPGLKSSEDARRLAGELAFASARLAELATDPPGLYAEVALSDDREDAIWLAFLIAYLGPLEEDDPWESIRAARTSWASGEIPELEAARPGPRGAHDPARGPSAITAYRAWAARAGSQAAAFTGEEAWTPERRFARVFERLALPGFGQPARFDLLVTLGRLGLCDLRADALHLGAAERTQLAAKRVFGIGDVMLLERRAAGLAEECALELDALDLALWNWERAPDEPRATLGAGPVARAASEPSAAIAGALGL